MLPSGISLEANVLTLMSDFEYAGSAQPDLCANQLTAHVVANVPLETCVPFGSLTKGAKGVGVIVCREKM